MTIEPTKIAKTYIRRDGTVVRVSIM